MNDQRSATPLILALSAGQPDAFALLYKQFGRRMLRVAATVLGRGDEAEDVLQDVFVNLARARHRLREVDDLEAYVFTMLRYAITARVKQSRRQRHHLHQLALARAGEFQTAPEAHDDMAAAVAQLPGEQREVVSLKIDAGLTFAQIGAVLGVSVNTAASRYRYAIDKLRRKFGEPT